MDACALAPPTSETQAESTSAKPSTVGGKLTLFFAEMSAHSDTTRRWDWVRSTCIFRSSPLKEY